MLVYVVKSTYFEHSSSRHKIMVSKHIIRVYSTGWICMYIYMVRTHLTKRKTTKNSG